MLKTVTFYREFQGKFRTSSYQGIYYSEVLNNDSCVKEQLNYLFKFEDGKIPYGISDGVQDILDYYDFEKDDRNFVIFLTEIRRKDQPEKGGFRWRKWGEYIGRQNVFCDYLYDEPQIESIFVWEAYEVGELREDEEEI